MSVLSTVVWQGWPGLVSVVAYKISDLPETPVEKREQLAKSLELAIDEFIKSLQGDTTIVTGWVLLAGTGESAEPGFPSGFTMTHSAGMPAYTQLGLLTEGVQTMEHAALIRAMKDDQAGPNPPF